MTVPEADRLTEMVGQSQRAVTETVDAVSHAWVEMLRGVSSPGVVPGSPMVPVVPAEVVDRFFDTGVQVLEAQRALVHGVLEMFRGPSGPAGR